MSFSPNWTWREVVEVLVRAPAVPERPEGVKTMRLGVLKLARFKRLKTSALNWSVNRSRMLVSFSAEKSQVARPGPIYVSLPHIAETIIQYNSYRYVKPAKSDYCMGEFVRIRAPGIVQEGICKICNRNLDGAWSCR